MAKWCGRFWLKLSLIGIGRNEALEITSVKPLQDNSFVAAADCGRGRQRLNAGGGSRLEAVLVLIEYQPFAQRTLALIGEELFWREWNRCGGPPGRGRLSAH